VSGALRLLLESTGRRVETAANVAEALASIRSDPPALALLDLTLPDGEGLALVDPLHGVGCTIVVALTGHDDEQTRERCLAAGCTDVLVKPVPTRELLFRTERWLAK
jgi:DNA-binding response OmpR family regulator